MNDMDNFKDDLISFLMERINHNDLREKFGCSVDFIAEGMIQSISTSIRIASAAKRMGKDVESNAN